MKSSRLSLGLAILLALMPGTQARATADGDCTSVSPSFLGPTFCALAGSVTAPHQCHALADFNNLACLSQDLVCQAGFSLATYCAEQYPGCVDECVNYLETCCPIQCCRRSCLPSSVLCPLLEVGTCEQAKPEICPCRATPGGPPPEAEAYCTQLLGTDDTSSACMDQCVKFLDQCCHVQDGNVRLVDAVITPLPQGELISGRLEVYFQEEWGKVCRTGFDQIDAEVACRQLGYHDQGKFYMAWHGVDGGLRSTHTV